MMYHLEPHQCSKYICDLITALMWLNVPLIALDYMQTWLCSNACQA